VYTKLLKQQDEIQLQAEELKTINNDLEEKRNEIEAQAEELREANETISTINQHLEEKVSERTEQLKQAYIELDTFFYRSSHDFRRPITTFIGLAEVAKITSKDEATLELFSKVKDTALSLDRMIRKLQTISDVGAQKMVYKEILVRELIGNILDNYSDEINTLKIKVVEEIDLKDSFKSYGALIHVILENLIENAIQFATPLNPYLKIRATSTSKFVILQVEDNGQAIPEEYHSRIFDMYLRSSISSKGNGLGLYIVKKAIQKLEGTIRFVTKPNEGTCFTVELPIENQ
jgi:signal transduction histidine kinase